MSLLILDTRKSSTLSGTREIWQFPYITTTSNEVDCRKAIRWMSLCSYLWLVRKRSSPRGGREGFLLIRYEDLIEDPQRELGKISALLRVDGSEEKRARAVELSSIGRMKKLEKEQSRQWAETKNTRQDKTFVRSGRAGEWRSALSQESVGAIESAFGPIMLSLGYELTKTEQATAGTSYSPIT